MQGKKMASFRIAAEQGPAKTDGNIQRHSVVKKKDPAKIEEGV